MANLDILTYGFSFVSDQGTLGWSTISLLRTGDRNIVVDTGPASRRALLLQALGSHGLSMEEIDTVILTHLHWDHCQNTDLFRNARIAVHPKELDYARSPARGDTSAAWYIADMLGKMNVEPVSDGDEIADGVSVLDTPGHTKGHLSVLAQVGDEKVLVAGDALPDGGAVKRRLPYNIFWDVDEAADSVEKIIDSSNVFYPGHDRPFRLDGEDLSYLHGPTQVTFTNGNEGGGVTSIAYTVHAVRPINIDTVQKGPPSRTGMQMQHSTLPITLDPPNSSDFRDALLLTKRAWIIESYADGSKKKRQWNAQNMGPRSNVIGNLRSRPEYRQGAWQEAGLVSLHVTIHDPEWRRRIGSPLRRCRDCRIGQPPL